MNPEEAHFKKRSITLMGHKTSVALEQAFWRVLEDVAKNEGITLNYLVQRVDANRTGSLSSALRLYALFHGVPKQPPSNR